LSKIVNKLIYFLWKENRRGKRGVGGGMEEICEEFGLSETELRGGGRRRKVSEWGKESLLFAKGDGDFHGRNSQASKGARP
jgi:hypothetical protein